MERNLYDLSHYAYVTGQIGRVQTLSTMPVTAGDSFELNVSGVIRLAPLRREVVAEAQVDVCVFYVPHRHVYPNEWTHFIRQGYDEGVNFTGAVTTAGERQLDYLTLREAPASIPLYLPMGYDMIWNQYFRIPSRNEFATGIIPTGGAGTEAERHRLFGKLGAQLPHVMNNYNIVDDTFAGWGHRDLQDADADVAAVATVDVRDFQRVQAELQSEILRVWQGDRYRDMLNIWQSTATTDADMRPEMVWRETWRLSGEDVDGTDDATLGSAVGKTQARLDFSIPRRYFAEHGQLWVLALVRMPVIHTKEQHYLYSQPNFTYLDLAADPNQWAGQKPEAFDLSRYLAPSAVSGSPLANIQVPFGNHLRSHPNNIHTKYAIAGYPFQTEVQNYITTGYCQDEQHAGMFQSSMLGHWQVTARMGVGKYSYIPTPWNSIKVGT